MPYFLTVEKLRILRQKGSATVSVPGNLKHFETNALFREIEVPVPKKCAKQSPKRLKKKIN